MEITIPGETTPVRIVDNNEDITWAGVLYQKFSFIIAEIGENSKGEVPRVDVRISNANQLMDYYVNRYDYYCKVNGFTPINVSIMVINSGNLSNPKPETRHEFELQQPKLDTDWATFTLGAASPYRKREPAGRILKNQCQHAGGFRGLECGYNGCPGDPQNIATTCNGTLARCRDYYNSTRFGGFPGAGDGAIRL